MSLFSDHRVGRVFLLATLCGAAWLEWRFRWLPAGFSIVILVIIAGWYIVHLVRSARMGRL
jgi:hypothetical protein